MRWKLTPRVKIYEALGAIADGRVEADGDSGKIYSSSRNKFYTVRYDLSSKAIMVNDNASFYKGYLGYPAIAYLMHVGEIDIDDSVLKHVKNIPWKDINQKYKNDFEKAVEFALRGLSGEERRIVETEIDAIYKQIELTPFELLGKKIAPPSGY